MTIPLGEVVVGDLVWVNGNAWRVQFINYIKVLGEPPLMLNLSGGRPLTGRPTDAVEVYR